MKALIFLISLCASGLSAWAITNDCSQKPEERSKVGVPLRLVVTLKVCMETDISVLLGNVATIKDNDVRSCREDIVRRLDGPNRTDILTSLSREIENMLTQNTIEFSNLIEKEAASSKPRSQVESLLENFSKTPRLPNEILEKKLSFLFGPTLAVRFPKPLSTDCPPVPAATGTLPTADGGAQR